MMIQIANFCYITFSKNNVLNRNCCPDMSNRPRSQIKPYLPEQLSWHYPLIDYLDLVLVSASFYWGWFSIICLDQKSHDWTFFCNPLVHRIGCCYCNPYWNSVTNLKQILRKNYFPISIEKQRLWLWNNWKFSCK